MPQLNATQALIDFIASSRAATTNEGLASVLVGTCQQLGYDYVNISIMRDYDLPQEIQGFAWATTYPADWTSYYLDRDCIRFDPVALSARGDVAPFYWSDLKNRLQLSQLQNSFLALSMEAGLYNGVGLPFVGARSRQGGIALATRRPDTPHVDGLEILWSISNLFYQRLCELVRGPASLLNDVIDLTARELDVLNLSFRGHTDRDIAAALDISEHTVNVHFRKSFKRLGVHTRVQAFAKATAHGIIDLP